MAIEINLSTEKRPASLREWFRTTILAGLLVLVPIGLTAYILDLIISTADTILHILPPAWRPPQEWLFPGIGLVFALLMSLVAGVLARNFLGRFFVLQFNRLVERIPVVASVYSSVRQIAEAFLGEERRGFRRVVMVEWPRRDCWVLAFVATETSPRLVEAVADGDATYLNLFIPTTPNPTSGFLFMVPAAETRAVDLTVDDAFKLIVSGGTLSLDQEEADQEGKPAAKPQPNPS